MIRYFVLCFVAISVSCCRGDEHSAAVDGGDASVVIVDSSSSGEQPTDNTNDAGDERDTDTMPLLPPDPAYFDLFDIRHVPEFRITLTESAVQGLEDDPYVYQSGTFSYSNADGGKEITIENVGVRLKGRASFRPIDSKPALKIKFNEYVSGGRFMGLRRLTLNNMVQDPSMMREVLGYAFFRAQGTPAPLCNLALVYLNDEYYGVYANVQTLDKTFLEQHYDDPSGDLYDTSNEVYFIDLKPGEEDNFLLDTNADTSDKSALLHAIDVLSDKDVDFEQNAETVLNLEQFFRVGTAQAILADWDGYFGATNNYKIYYDPQSGVFELFPWGIDQVLGIIDNEYRMINYNIDHSDSERPNALVIEACRADSDCYNRYKGYVTEALTIWKNLALDDMLEGILSRIESHAERDTKRPYSQARFLDGIDDLRDFLDRRAQIVEAQL